MAKTCPSCGYNPIGPFTDNCPICAEPVRNVRSDPTRFAWPAWSASLPPWARWVLGGAAVLLLTVGGCCGLGMWRVSNAIGDARKMMEQAQAAAEADRKARTVAVTAADLLQEFQHDSAAGDRKYRNKHLVVSGIVERVGEGGDDAFFVILHAGDATAPLKIECFFDFEDEQDEIRIKRLGQGQAATVRGEYGGRVSHLQVRGCVLVR